MHETDPDIHPTLVRLTQEMYQWLRREAFSTGQSQTAIVTRALTDYRNRQETRKNGE